MLINPAICLPSFWPISSTISMHSKSSLLTAVMISSNVGGFSAVRFESMELSPLPILSNRMRCSADPEASVSRHPFLPQWHSISLSKTLTCPNSPENPDFPESSDTSMFSTMKYCATAAKKGAWKRKPQGRHCTASC